MRMRCLMLGCIIVWITGEDSSIDAADSVFDSARRVQAATYWHHPLYLGRGGYWWKRVPVIVRNRSDAEIMGKPVGVAIGDEPGKAALTGARIESLRVVDAAGTEMLFAIVSVDGEPLTKGHIPAGATLYIPGGCVARGSRRYYVYFDNPSAWGVPDFLPGFAIGDLNGSFEKGKGSFPAGWREKSADATHRNAWVSENPRSGKRCLKTVVDVGADPNWVSVYRSRMTIVPGALYTIKAWVRARNATGRVGWFIHVGNSKQPMMYAPIQETGAGTYDWREVTFEFVAPAEATMMSMGTVLRGQGTAWFDDVTITSDAPVQLTAEAGKTEFCSLRSETPASGWELPTDDWSRRLAIQVGNPDSQARQNVLVHGDFNEALRGTVAASQLRLMLDGKPVSFCLLSGNLVFPASLPSRTFRTYWLYVAKDADTAAKLVGQTILGSDIPSDQVFVPISEDTDPRAYAALLGEKLNLAKNASFEHGEDSPDQWFASVKSGVQHGLVMPGVFGERCASLTVPHQAETSWVGWRQDVSVEPNRSYLFAAWIRAEDVQNGSVSLHAHQRKEDGTLSSQRAYLSAGAPMSGTVDWTLADGVTHTPADTTTLQLHLTMNATGTVKHDGVLVAEVLPATIGRLDTRVVKNQGVAVWSVNPIVKVFRDDLPPALEEPVQIQLARNEQEALQLVVRSPKSIENFRYELDVPQDSRGRKLSVLELGVVGYVPIDHRTSYYRSESPAWHRKFPDRPGSCDGWAGWWPDPIIPMQVAELAAGECQPLWITFATDVNTLPGEYTGAVRLYDGQRLLKRVPVSITVWDFSLPEVHSLAAIYDIRFAGESWDREERSRPQLREDCMRFMAKRKLCGDRVHVQPKFTRDGARISADFSEYDKAMTLYFDELKFPRAYTPNFFYVFGWAHLPKPVLGEQPYEGKYPFEGVNRSMLRSEYKRAYQECLRLYWTHMQEKGWADKLVLYISDEPHFTHEEIRAQMKAACDMIHEVDPNIPIFSSTWRHCPEWNGYLDVWGVGSYGCFPVEEMQARKRDGDRIWFTTDGQMCTDTPYCAIERLLPHYCFHYNVEAYEFWGIAWLTYDPYQFGWHRYIPQSSGPGSSFHVRYPNGDGFLVYPGGPVDHDGFVSSIRIEAARDGVEDFEYLSLLKRLATPRDDRAALALLKKAEALAQIPNPGGRYSSRILPDPEAVPRLREQMAAAILRLSRAAKLRERN